MDPRRPPREPLLTRDLFRDAWRVFRATRQAGIVLALVGLALPQIIHLTYFDVRAVDAAANVRGILASGGPGGMIAILETVVSYYGRYFGTTAGLWFLFLMAYFGLVHLAVSHFRGNEATLGEAVLSGLRMVFPRGLALTALLFLLGLVAQVLAAPAVLIAILGLMIPVIMATENLGGFRSAWIAITLRYTRDSRYSGWGVMFALSTVGALFYTGIIGLGLGTDVLMRADEWLGVSRSLWTIEVGGLPMGPIYLLGNVVEIVVSLVFVGFLPALTAALYFKVVGSRPIISA